MVNVIVTTKPVINVTVNTSSGVISSIQPVTLQNVPILSSVVTGTTSLAELTDVTAPATANTGDTLVYSEDTEKYVVGPLDLIYTKGTLDAGEF